MPPQDPPLSAPPTGEADGPVEADSSGGALPLVPLLPLSPPRPLPPSGSLAPAPGLLGGSLAIGSAAFLLLYSVGMAVGKSYGASLFSIPFFVGYITALLSRQRPFRNAALVLLISLLVLIAALREGVVCVLFALPLLAGTLFLGALCGDVSKRFVDSRRKQIGAITGLLLISAGWQAVEGHRDDPARHPLHRAEAQVRVPAPPARVFAALTDPLEVQGPWPAILRVGLPIPRRIQVERPGPGGRVRIDFSHGAFARVTAWEPGASFAFQVERYQIQDLPFHITRLGRGPHYGLKPERASDWLTLGEVRYTLSPAPGPGGAGGTILGRTMTWRRHLAPGFYFGWLQERIMSRAQERLLQLVRDRIAADPTPSPRSIAHASQ
jgi:hypothetical protein